MSKKVTIEDIKERFERFDCTLITKEYLGCRGKYEFICRKHKEYGIQSTFIKNLGRGCCCHYCAFERKNFSRQVPYDDLKKITESKGFIFVDAKYIDNKRYIIYKCKKHINKGEQKTIVTNMRRSKGNCPYCLNRYRTHDDFINEMNNINPNIEILSKFINTDSKIKCECRVCGHVWENDANNLLQGQGCKKCSSKKNGLKCRHSQEWFCTEMKNKQPNIEVLSEYVGIKEHIKCRCKIDENIWFTTPDSLLNNKTGCPICANRKNGERCRKTNDEFLRQLKIINPNILPMEEYNTNHEKMLCKCLVHNYQWYVSPNKILRRRTGCPKCASYHNENVIANILDKWGFEYTMQKRFSDCKDINTLPFDFYLNKYNTAIEYDGEQHYYPIFKTKYPLDENISRLEYVQKHDEIKNQYCKDNNIFLIRIPYWDNDDIEYILFDNFVKNNIIKEI
ncbi:hypothetical protein MT487_01065 [Lachnospiraceae bacterium NSJ-171]|nr:hypothetical protein [Lachnospiraceae bacterium NSJ-171]